MAGMQVYRGLLDGVQPVAIKVMDTPDGGSLTAVTREIQILMESRYGTPGLGVPSTPIWLSGWRTHQSVPL
jgi:hypothetical protein